MLAQPREIAFRDEAQTLFIVVQGTLSGREAAREHWREGFWPMLWGVLVVVVVVFGDARVGWVGVLVSLYEQSAACDTLPCVCGRE